MLQSQEETKRKPSVLISGLSARKFTASTLALATVLSAVTPAWATIDNTVTATGSSPGNTDDVTATADETVDVADAAPAFTFTKTADDTTDVAIGDTITYTYTVVNTGNVTINEISVADVHEGSGAPPVPGSPTSAGPNSTDDGVDNDFDNLAPGETATFTATYVVTIDDVANQLDNDLDNTATVTATPAAGAFDPGQVFDATETVDLEDRNASLAVTKTADDDTDVIAGQVITYTYVVTNNGNVPITEVTLSDNVTAGSGTPPTPTLVSLTNTSGNSSDDALDDDVDLLFPGDSATFTGTYTVTQSDVDNLQ